MRRLTKAEVSSATAALLGPDGERLRRAMLQKNLGHELTEQDGAETARGLGWLDDDFEFTELGALVRDPLREYTMLADRGYTMMSADVVPALEPANLAGRRVLEVGSGAGCQLLPLQAQPGYRIGLEPSPVSLQLMPVLAELAGVAAPAATQGVGEHLPFADACFDVVVCYSSHQYMDIDVALAEMGRVLAPDGQLIIIGNSFWHFVPETVGRFFGTRDLGTLKYDIQAIVNTMAYSLLGRRVLTVDDGSMTSMPVYPSGGHMRRRLGELGLEVDDDQTTLLASKETALFATHRA